MDQLQFYASSANKDAGTGVGDNVSDPTVYRELNKIDNWRRMFSSLWPGNPFNYKGQMYTSFEHAYQAEKYNLTGYPDTGYLFSLGSNSKYSKDMPRGAKRLIKLNATEIAQWDAVRRDIKDDIYKCKFTRDTIPGKALILTRDAHLINAGPRIRKVRCTRLESIRTALTQRPETKISE